MKQYNRYPVLEVNTELIRNNALAMTTEMKKLGLSVCGVIKVSDGDLEVVKAYHEGGCAQIGSSRTAHLKKIREAYPAITTLLLRIPMLSEAEDVVKYADISLESEEDTLLKLNKEAEKIGKIHSVILMIDVGDRREGVVSSADLIKLGKLAESLQNIRLLGIGTNYGCVSGVIPDEKNLAFQEECVNEIERAIGRKLDVVSGGNSTLLNWILREKPLPKCINHIRTGGTVINPINMRNGRGLIVEGESVDTVRLLTEVVEVKVKPSVKSDHVGKNWKGEEVKFEDKGERKRAIIGIGSMDIGDCFNLIPLEEGMELIACSSDHTVIDVTDSKRDIKVGDIIPFYLKYSALLYAFTTKQVNIEYVTSFE